MIANIIFPLDPLENILHSVSFHVIGGNVFIWYPFFLMFSKSHTHFVPIGQLAGSEFSLRRIANAR